MLTKNVVGVRSKYYAPYPILVGTMIHINIDVNILSPHEIAAKGHI